MFLCDIKFNRTVYSKKHKVFCLLTLQQHDFTATVLKIQLGSNCNMRKKQLKPTSYQEAGTIHETGGNENATILTWSSENG